MQFLNINGRLYQMMTRIFDLLKLNSFWILFSLPIVTIGASTAAAFAVTLKIAEDKEGKIFDTFYKSFKENLKQGTQIGFIIAIIAYAFYMNIELMIKLEDAPIFFLISTMIIGFFGLMYFTYVFPLCARYHNSLLGTFKNAIAISKRYFVQTLLLWTLIALLILVFLFNTTLIFFGILFGPVTLFLAISGVSVRLFNKIETESK